MKIKTMILSATCAINIMLINNTGYSRDYSEWLDSCQPYRETVEKILDEEEVSRDFYYLMVAESKCTSQAESNKGALGFWQMMPKTAKAYGCNNLHDLVCATSAAAKYIRHLQVMFKYNFDDIISGYNIGGRNYKKNGSTRESRGLLLRVKEIKSSDQ